MKTRYLLLLMILTGIFTPSFAKKPNLDKNIIKAKIMEREHQFCIDLQQYGAQFAFEKYADENAVINRGNDSLIYGKKGIAHFYSKPIYKTATADWKPDFVEVSDDGTLAYTYGKYEWIFVNDNNEKTIYKGIFHTVWKKNKDGNWYYVWD